jgi:hypothetical protein
MVARVVIGQALLEVGRPEGTVALGQSRTEGPADAPALATAVRTRSDPAAPTGGLDEAERILASGRDVTDAVNGHVAGLEGQMTLLEAIAAGRAGETPELARELDLLAALITRLARDGRRGELIRTVQAAEAAFVLARRWLDLAASLQRTAEAARALPDRRAEAWALHELGTFAAAAGDVSRGGSWLRDALRRRQELGDTAGAAVTKQNLDVLVAPPATIVQSVDRGPAAVASTSGAAAGAGGGLAWPWMILCLVLIGLAGGAAGWAVGQSSSSASSTTVTSTATGTGSTATVTTAETTTQQATTTEQVTTTATVTTTVTTSSTGIP